MNRVPNYTFSQKLRHETKKKSELTNRFFSFVYAHRISAKWFHKRSFFFEKALLPLSQWITHILKPGASSKAFTRLCCWSFRQAPHHLVLRRFWPSRGRCRLGLRLICSVVLPPLASYLCWRYIFITALLLPFNYAVILYKRLSEIIQNCF